jgi:transcriptional/translational regulatory protein YebC/TACO1
MQKCQWVAILSVAFLCNHAGLIIYKADELHFDYVFNYYVESEVPDAEIRKESHSVIYKVTNFGKVRLPHVQLYHLILMTQTFPKDMLIRPGIR